MPSRPLLTRRHFGQLGLAGLVGMGLHGRSARAGTSGSRRYLFLFARGGWDFSYTFAHLADNESFHWHFELQPRTGQLAGLELGGDMYINSVPAEVTAARLRDGLQN